MPTEGYDTIRHDIAYLTCSKKLTCSQLSPPHGRVASLVHHTAEQTEKIKEKRTKNKSRSMINPVRSSVEIAGGVEGFNPPVNVFNPLLP